MKENNCRRLMKIYGEKLNKIKDIFIKTNKGVAFVEGINKVV